MALQDEIWKKILLFGTPALIASAVGLYYYYVYSAPRKESRNAENTGSPVPEETPLEAAIGLKNRGNRYFKAGRYTKAIECYTEALEQCPPTAVGDRATFFQNRAAAHENLRQLEAAVEDCNAALELSPTYLKALNRRARLYERLNDLPRWLFDITACCLLERFRNNENIMSMDRVLKQIGQKLAREEPPRLPRTLPSLDFVKFYFSSWAHNPFTLEAMMIKKKASLDATNATNGLTEAVKKKEVAGEKEDGEVGEEDCEEEKEAEMEQDGEEEKKATEQQPEESEEVFVLPQRLSSAYEHLEDAFKKLQAGEYEKSWNLVAIAMTLFNSAPDVDLRAFERSIFGDREKPESARARALLLEATFKALSGDAEGAKSRFLSIGEAIFAHPTIRVNALIKAGALYMTIDKDISGCMYCFQQAQTLNPQCPDVYLHRGQINLLADNIEAAEKDLYEAVRLMPDFSVAQAQWLYLLFRKSHSEGKDQKMEEHLKGFQKLIEKWPDCVETHSLYAQVLTERGEFQKSDAEYARIIELAPNSGLAYSHRGLLYLRWKQDRDAADEWFRRALEVDPRCELAWELRGQLAMEKGELETAAGYFQHALDEARTLQDRSHLFALREGVKAQINAVKVYGISIASLFEDLRSDILQGGAAGGGGIPVPI